MAAAAAAEVALPLFHAADTMMTVLVWQMGSVMLFTALGALFGRITLRFFRIPRPT
ncbi:NrsF family protein [Acidocella sp.]|uniref:NrsF family protein n=1 Tax=Acidocella sp. TaxID=50710 RepID=UPI0025BA8E40|nr:NrsF family protein [Acidocella sp.]